MCTSPLLVQSYGQMSRIYAHSFLRLVPGSETSAQYHLWVNIDEDKSCRILETLISRFNLMVLDRGKHMHIFHSFSTHSCLELAIYNPIMSHFRV